MLPRLSDTILRNGQAKEKSGPCILGIPSKNVQGCSGPWQLFLPIERGSKLLCIYIEWTTIHINGHALGIFITTAICHSIFQKPGLSGTFQALSHWLTILMTSHITNPVRTNPGRYSDALKSSTFWFIQNRSMCFRDWEISPTKIKELLESSLSKNLVIWNTIGHAFQIEIQVIISFTSITRKEV